MKIGIMSDAHGNLCGVEKCIDSLLRSGVDEIIHLGDSVGYFPDVNEVLRELSAAKAICLSGNHEAMLLGHLGLDKAKDNDYRITECRNRISRENVQRISRFLPFRERTINGRRLLFVHGSPWDPLDGYVYPDSDLGSFEGLEFDAVFMGHTHLPFTSRVNGTLVANAGSCGLPRDHGDQLSWLIYDTQQSVCQIVRSRFDAQRVIQKYGASISRDVVDCLMRK